MIWYVSPLALLMTDGKLLRQHACTRICTHMTMRADLACIQFDHEIIRLINNACTRVCIRIRMHANIVIHVYYTRSIYAAAFTYA